MKFLLLLVLITGILSQLTDDIGQKRADATAEDSGDKYVAPVQNGLFGHKVFLLGKKEIFRDYGYEDRPSWSQIQDAIDLKAKSFFTEVRDSQCQGVSSIRICNGKSGRHKVEAIKFTYRKYVELKNNDRNFTRWSLMDKKKNTRKWRKNKKNGLYTMREREVELMNKCLPLDIRQTQHPIGCQTTSISGQVIKVRGYTYMQTTSCDAWDLLKIDRDDDDAKTKTIDDLDLGLDEGLYGFEIETTKGQIIRFGQNKTAFDTPIYPTDWAMVYDKLIGMQFISWKGGFLTFQLMTGNKDKLKTELGNDALDAQINSIIASRFIKGDNLYGPEWAIE